MAKKTTYEDIVNSIMVRNLKDQGHTVAEIAQASGLSEYKVRRLLNNTANLVHKARRKRRWLL